VRQLAVRARRRVDERRPRRQSSAEQREELADRFFAAVRDGDLAGLESLLAADVRLTGDGGGKVPALARALQGRSRVAHTFTNWMRTGAKIPGASMRRAEVNGAPGAIALNADGAIIGVWVLEIAGGEIVELHSIVNPEKLGHLGETAGWYDALKGSR